MSEKPFATLDGLTLTETMSKAFAADKITAPTEVQRVAIPPILSGENVLIHSGTGTGKTLAYVLPLLQLLRDSSHRAVIFAPGAELAMQTLRIVNAYKDAELKTAPAIATSNSKRQRKRLQQSTRLIVGTPDRLLELFKGGKLKGVHTIVFDELEPILRSRQSAFLYELLSRSEPKRQLIVASATLGEISGAFVEQFMSDCSRVTATERPLQEAISHHLVPVSHYQGKEVAIARFIQNNRCKRAILFATEPRHQAHLFHFLEEHHISVATLNRDRSKNQRKQALSDFKSGKVKLLLTTDAAARGIDVPDIEWVLHYDLPLSAQAYTHRAGRTGRAGKKGCSVVFADKATLEQVHNLKRKLKLRFLTSKLR
jgi:ATP-dependent RNA helicase DeaD